MNSSARSRAFAPLPSLPPFPPLTPDLLPPLPPMPTNLLVEGDELIPKPMFKKERDILLYELESAITKLFTLQSSISDKIEENTLSIKLKIDEINRLAFNESRAKKQQLNSIYSDIQYSGDEDCEIIQKDIDIVKKQIISIKERLKVEPTQQQWEHKPKESDLVDLEYNLERLNESLKSRKDKTSSLLIDEETKGDEELTEIKNKEKYDIIGIKNSTKGVGDLLVKELSKEISNTIKNFALKGVFIPPIYITRFNTIALPALLLKYNITGKQVRR